MGLGFKKAPFHLGLNKFIIESDSQSKPETDHAPEASTSDSEEDSFLYPLTSDLAALFAEPDDFVPRICTGDDTDTDSDTPPPTTELTFEQWKEKLSADLNYHGNFYMPDHLHVQLDQEQPCHNLTGERNMADVASMSTDSHE